MIHVQYCNYPVNQYVQVCKKQSRTTEGKFISNEFMVYNHVQGILLEEPLYPTYEAAKQSALFMSQRYKSIASATGW